MTKGSLESKVSERLREALGTEMFTFLKQIVPKGIDIAEVQELMRSGKFQDAKPFLRRVLQVAYDSQNSKVSSSNPFEDDPAVVAERLVGKPIAYVEGIRRNSMALVTDTAAFVEPRGNCPELFTAEPGTIGWYYKPQHGGYGALLIAAHKVGTTGVVSIEGVTVGDERLSMTNTASLLHAREEAGKSIYQRTSRIVVQPADGCVSGYDIRTQKNHGGAYFALRKN